MNCRLSHEDLQDTLLEAYKSNFEKYKHLSAVIKDVLSLGLAEETKVHAIWFYAGFIHSSATKIEKLQTPEWKNGKYLEVHNYLRPYLVGNLTFDYDTLISNIESILKRPLDVEVKDVETTLLEDITDITSIAPDQLASSVESIIKTIKDNTNILDPVIIDAANTKSVMLLKKLQTALSTVSGPLKVTLLNRINQEIVKFSTQTETNEQGYVDLPNIEEIGIYKGEPIYIQENKDGSFHEVVRDKAKNEYQYFNPGQVNHLTAVQDADVLQRSKIYDRNQNTQIDAATGRTRINGSEIFAGWSVGEKFNQGKKRGNLGAYNKNTTYKESERVDKSIQKQVAAKSAKGRNFKNSVEITADTAIVDFYAKRLGRINEKLGNKPVPFEVTEKPQHGTFIQSNTSYKDFVAFVVPSTGFKVKLSTPEGDLSFLMDSIADMAIVSKDGTRTKVDFENPTHRQILKNNLQVRRYGNEPFEKGKFSTKYFAISDEQLDQLIEQGKLYRKFENEVLERLESGDKNIKDIFLKYYDVNNVITSVNYTNEVELDGDLAELIDTYDGRLDVTIKDAQGNEDISIQVPLVITKNKNGIWDIQDPLNQGEKIIGKDGKEYSSFKIFFEENYPELDVQEYGSKYPTRNALYLSLEKTPEGYTVKSVPLAFKNYISSSEDLVGLAATMSFTAAKGAIKEGNTFVQNFNNNFWGFDVIDRNIYPEFKIIKDTNGVKSFGITFQMLPPLPGVAITTEQKNAFNKYSKDNLTIPIDDKLLKNFFDTTKQIFKEAGIEMPTDATLQEISTLAGEAFKKVNKPELLNKLQEDYKLLQEDIRSKFNTTMAKADPSIVSSRLANNSIFTSADGPLKLQKRIGKINTYNVINDFNVVKTDIDSTIVVTPKNFDGRIKLIEKSQKVENALNNETTAVNPVTVVVPEEDVENPFIKPDENKKPPIPPINLDDFDVNGDDVNFSVIQSLEGIMLATPEESAAEIKAMQEFLPDFLNFKSEDFKNINVDGIALGYVKGLTAHINATINAKGVPFHEGFHLFFNNLLDTPQKTYYLQKMNKATGGFKTDSKGRYLMFNGEKKYYDQFVKERRYFHLSENQIKNLMHEEFMADGWADFISTHKAPRTWLEKIFRFLEKIFNMFTAKGRIRNLYFDIAAGKFKTARLQDTKGNDEPVYSIYKGVPTLKLKNPLNPSDLTPKLDSTNVIPSHITNQVSNLVLAEMVKLKNVNKGLKPDQLFDMAVDTVAKDFDIDAIVETNKGNEAKIREVLEFDFNAAQWLLGQFHLKNKPFKVANLSGIESFNNQLLSSKNSSQINLSVANHELFKNDVLKEFKNIETIEDIPSEFESSVDDAELDELEKDSYKDSGSYITAKPDEGDGAFRQMFKYITYEYIHPTLGIKLKRTVDPKNIFNTIRKVTANCLTKDQVVPKLKSEIDRLSANVKNFYDNIQPTLDSNIIPESDAKTINLRDSLKAVYDTLDDICKFNDNQIPTRNEHVFNQFAKVFNLIDASLIQINLYSSLERNSETGIYSPKKQTFRTTDIVVGTDLNSVRLNFLERIRLLSVSEETAKNATAKLSEIGTIFKDKNVIRDKFISNGVLNEAVFQKYINDIYSTLANLNLGIPRDVVEMVLLKDIWNAIKDVNVFPVGTNARTLLKNNKELLDYKLSNIDYEFFSASIPYLIKIGNNAGNSQNEVLVNFKKIFVTTYVNGVGEYLLKYDSSLASSVTRNANGDLVQKYVRPTPAHIAVLKLHSENNIVNGLQKVINEDHNGFQSFFADNPLLNTNDVRNTTFLNALEVNSFAGFKQTQNSDFGLSNTRDASTFKDIDDTAYLLSMMGLFANRNILKTLDGSGSIKTFKRILTQFEATSTSIVIDGLLDNYTDVNGNTSLRENGTSKIASTLLKLVNQEYNLIKKNFHEHANNSAEQQWESYNINPEKDRGYKFNHLSDFFAMNTSEDFTVDSERATNLKIRRGLSEKLIENASQGKSLNDFIKENPEDAETLKTQLDKYAEEQYARFDNQLKELNIKDVDLPTNEIVPGKQEAETFKPIKLKKEFFYNTWVNTLFVNQMFEGSMAANVGTFAEYFKRNKSGAAAGSNISIANAKTKTYRASVVGKIKFWINDNLQGSMLVEPPRDSQGNPLPGWKQVDAFDGQSINTINRRMRIADSQGSLTPELEESLHKMRFMTHSNAEYSKTIQKLRDAGIIFNSLKTVTAAPMVYLKQSEHTLIRKDVSILKVDKQANRDQAYADLDILWRKIDYYTSQIENGVEGYNDIETNEYVSYEKLYKNTIQSIHSFYEPIPGRTALHKILDSMEFHRIEQFLDKNGSKKATPRTINLDLQAIAAGTQAYVKLDESLVDVPNAYTFIQVETGGLSRSITDGIQKKLLIMTQLDANSPEYAAIEKEIKAYDANLTELVKNETNTINRLLKSNAGGVVGAIYSKIADGLRKQGNSSMLKWFELDAEGKPVYDPSVPGVGKAVEFYLFSYFNTNLFDKKVAGEKYYHVSPFGYEIMEVSDKKGNKKIITQDEYKKNPSRYKNVTTRYPSVIKEEVTDPLTGEKIDRYVVEVIIPKELQAVDQELVEKYLAEKWKDTFFATRTPTEGKRSMMVCKVVDFIDEAYGNSIIVPFQMHMLSGSDFDIDSLYAYKYSTYRGLDGQKIIYGDYRVYEQEYGMTTDEAKFMEYLLHMSKDTIVEDLVNNELDRINEQTSADKTMLLKRAAYIFGGGVKNYLLNAVKEVVKGGEGYNTASRLLATLNVLTKLKDAGLPTTVSELKNASYNPVSNVLYNKVLDNKIRILQDPAVFTKFMVNPNERADVAIEVYKEAVALKGVTESEVYNRQNYATPTALVVSRSFNSEFKDALGIAASFNKGISLLETVNAILSEAAMTIYQVNADKTISNKVEVANRIIEGAVQKVGGAIGMYADASKNPYPGPLNLNSITTPVMLAMFATGVDQMAAIMYQSLSPVKNLIQDFNKTSGSAYSQSFFSRPVSFSTFLKRKLFELEKQVSEENPEYSDAYAIHPTKEGVEIMEDSYKLVWLGKDSIKKDTEEQIASRDIPIENNGWAVVDAKTNERLPKNLEDLIILKKFADYTKIANDISFKITKSTDMLKSLAPDQDKLDRLIFTVDDLMNNPSSTVFTDESINNLFKKNPVLGESLKALKSLNAVSKDVLIERTAFMKGFISLFEKMWAYQRSGDTKSEVRKDIKAFLGLQFQKLALLQNPNTMESSTYLEQLDADNFLSAETINSYYFLKDKFPNNAFLNNLTPIEHGSSAKKATLLELTSSVNDKLKDDMKNDIVFLLTHDDLEVRKNAYRIAYHGMIKSGAQGGRGSYYDILPAFLSKPMSDLMTKFRTELTNLDEIVSKDSAYESKRVNGKRKLKDSAIKKYNEGINKLFETTFGGADLSNILAEGIVKILSDKIKTTDYTYSMTSALNLRIDMSRMYEIVSNISPNNVNNIFEVIHFENGKTDYYAKTLDIPVAERVSLNKEDKIELFTPVGKTVEFNLTSVSNSGIESSINSLLYNNGITYHDNGNYSFPLYKINIYNQLLVLKQINGESIGKNFANTLTENDLENLQGSVTLRGNKAVYEVVAREGSDKISALAFSHENGSKVKNYMENWQQTYSVRTAELPVAFEQGVNLTAGRVFGMSPSKATRVDHRNKVYLLPNGELLNIGNRFVRYEFADGKLKPFENGTISRNAIEGDNLNLFARILKEDSWESLTNNPNLQEFLKGEKFIFVYDLQNENKPPQPVAPIRVEVKEETSQDTNNLYNKLDKKSTQPTESTGFQGYKGGFENTGKGTPQGDGKDNAMRQVADGFIGEINDKLELPQKTPYDLKSATSKTSTGTSFKTIGIKTKGYSQDYYNEGPTVSSGKLVTTDDMAKVVMLARNKEFSGKPLADTTKESILDAHKEGVQFVVGDMPGVDSQFIDYLQEIGAKFTIYHTGSESRIQVKQPTTQPSTGVKVVSEPYGVVTVETNPSAEKTQEFVKLIQPQIKAQAYKENASIYANDMFMYGLRWTRKSKAFKFLINKSFANKGRSTLDPLARDGYVYDTVDQNGKPLPPVSDLQPIINEIEKALGRDMSDYDAVIGNIYLPGQNIAIHRDTTESESARNYPVIVYTIGNNSGIGIYENEKQPGAISFAVDKKTVIPTKDGTIYTFGIEGKGRFELSHDTPKDIKRDKKFPPITLPDGRVITNYTITLTFRRAADLKPGMPTSPSTITTQPTSIEPTRIEDTGYKYYGAPYTIILDNNYGVGIDVKDYKGKPAAKQKLLDAYNANPDVDPQNGKQFRNFRSLPTEELLPAYGPGKLNILDFRNVKLNYTAGQKKALLDIQNLIDKNKQANYLLAGYAGTGKTTIAENIAKYAKEKGKDVAILAPTNKAANVLTQKLKDAGVKQLSASTIHAAIYGQPDPETGEWVPKKGMKNSVIIVDESSMISKELMEDLLEVAENKSNIFIFMGDGFQLEQIGQSSNLFESKDNTSLFEKTYGVKLDGVTELKEVKRQSLDSNILKVATLSRTDNESYIPSTSLPDFKVSKDKAEFVEDFKKSIRESEDSVMIVATNNERLGMNAVARNEKFGKDKGIINANDTLISVANSASYKNSETFKILSLNSDPERLDIQVKTSKNSIEKFEGYLLDAINDKGENVTLYHLPLLNIPSLYHGQLLEYAMENKEFHDKLESRFLIFEDDKGREHISKNLIITTFGYAITAHKSQGSQWQKVFVNQNYVAPSWNAARWYYTAITRSAKDVIALNSGNNKRISSQEMDDKLNQIVTPDVQEVTAPTTEINNETINEQQQKLRDEIAKIKQEKKDDSNECNNNNQ